MYGTQTAPRCEYLHGMFENDVKMYGTQTINYYLHRIYSFENDVKMYGTQTNLICNLENLCLRMM